MFTLIDKIYLPGICTEIWKTIRLYNVDYIRLYNVVEDFNSLWMLYIESISWTFSGKSEVNALELLENLEEMFPYW